MTNKYSMSWTIGVGENCVGGNAKDVQQQELISTLTDVIRSNGTLTLSIVDAPEIGPQELSVEIENGNAVLALGEDDGEEYHVRSYNNHAPLAEEVEILGNLWDGRMVCHGKDEIMAIFSAFYMDGDVSKEILS